mgnify:CR=1 FL=1
MDPAHDSTVRQELDRSDAVGRLLEDHVVQTVKGADAVLKDGSNIRLTQSALVLENLIGQFLFSKAAESRQDAPAPAPRTP